MNINLFPNKRLTFILHHSPLMHHEEILQQLSNWTQLKPIYQTKELIICLQVLDDFFYFYKSDTDCVKSFFNGVPLFLKSEFMFPLEVSENGTAPGVQHVQKRFQSMGSKSSISKGTVKCCEKYWCVLSVHWSMTYIHPELIYQIIMNFKYGTLDKLICEYYAKYDGL